MFKILGTGIISLIVVIVTHELGHYLVARTLGYSAIIEMNINKLIFRVRCENIQRLGHKKIIALAGCLSSLLCAVATKILFFNSNLSNYILLYSLIFLLNMHPKFPDGKIFWENH